MADNVPEWQQMTNFCVKHNQPYMRFLSTCPVCVGEMLAGLPKTPLGRFEIAEELVPNKMYGPEVADGHKPAPVDRPVQMAMFE